MKAKINPLGPVDPKLAALGFQRIKPVRIKRITAEVSGKTKVGKTRLMLTMTPPIGIINTDRDLEDLLPEFPDVDLVVVDLSKDFVPGEQLTQNQAKMLEAKFFKAYQGLMDSKGIRSIGISKWTTLWEVARFAEFGVASVKAHHYVPVNLRMRGYLQAAKECHKNVLLEQDMKEEWVNEKPTGRWIVDGFKYTPGLMQLNMQMAREEDGDRDFVLSIAGCGVNAELVGQEFRNDEIDWKKLAPLVLEDTDPADWR